MTSSANPSAAGQEVTFTATVELAAAVAPTPTGEVVFTDATTTLGTVPLDPTGRATFTTGRLTVGDHVITAHYGGAPNLGASDSAPLTQTVDRAATTTSVTAGPAPSVFGQAVMFTATVAPTAPGRGAPRGTVIFTEGADTLGEVQLEPGTTQSAATFTTAQLPAGDHPITATYVPITATYVGDGTHQPSTSEPFTQTVDAAPTASTLTVDPNPVARGEPLTLAATVDTVAPGAGTPTGTVTFTAGTTDLGSAPLVGGTAQLVTTALPEGHHHVVAAYAGTPDFAPSASGPSPEGDVTVFSGIHAYLDGVYNLFLGRDVDPSGLEVWSAWLAQGDGALGMTTAIATSSEARIRQVDQQYVMILDRRADRSGEAYWSQYVATGGRFDVFQAALLGSGEFFHDAGGTDTDFVEALYRSPVVAARDATPAEILWWTTILRNQP